MLEKMHPPPPPTTKNKNCKKKQSKLPYRRDRQRRVSLRSTTRGGLDPVRGGLAVPGLPRRHRLALPDGRTGLAGDA